MTETTKAAMLAFELGTYQLVLMLLDESKACPAEFIFEYPHIH